MAENKEIIENYLRDKGLNDKAIAGVMGNIQQESNFSTTATNSRSGAYGLFQWLGSRKRGLENYAKVTGRSKDDINTQLDYFWNELETTESKTKSILFDSNYNSAGEYAKAFEKTFERSGGSALAKRQTYAENIYNNMNNKTTGTGFDSTTSSGFSGTSGKISESIGLEWWGDIVVVLLAIILLIMGVTFIGLSITSNNVGVNVLNKIKGGGKSG
jgi:hypothetical protein